MVPLPYTGNIPHFVPAFDVIAAEDGTTDMGRSVPAMARVQQAQRSVKWGVEWAAEKKCTGFCIKHVQGCAGNAFVY